MRDVDMLSELMQISSGTGSESTSPRVGEETDKNRSLRVLCDLSGERIVISLPSPFWGCLTDSIKLIFVDYE